MLHVQQPPVELVHVKKQLIIQVEGIRHRWTGSRKTHNSVGPVAMVIDEMVSRMDPTSPSDLRLCEDETMHRWQWDDGGLAILPM